MRLLIVQHDDTAGLGSLAAPLTDRGADLEIWFPARTAEPSAALQAYDGLIVLGGVAHPDQDAEHPWLAADRALLLEALDLELPTLGICLGAQLLAQVVGAGAARMARPEIGWYGVRFTPDARHDPLLAGLGDRFCAVVWHHYGFVLPPDVPVLGRTTRAQHAFRVGSSAWGLQFHIEADAATVATWAAGSPDELDAHGSGAPALLRETAERMDDHVRAAHELADRFADLVQRRIDGRPRVGPSVTATAD
jgi:GMP synthase-like glutamine amidotransferase